MIISTNMSNAECLKLNGTLPTDRIESLIEIGNALDVMVAVDCQISEALDQYPTEGFLQDAITEAQYLAKNCRGENKNVAESLLKMLEELQSDTNRSSEYGASELRAARKAIDNLQPEILKTRND